MSEAVILEINKDQAFALFEFLARYSYDGKLSVESVAEEATLKELCGNLDDELVERFRKEYLNLSRKRNTLNGKF